MAKIEHVSIPETGVHLLPILTSPAILQVKDKPQLVMLEMTPVRAGQPTESRCHIPLLRADALKLTALLLDHAEQQGWSIPEGAIVRRTIQ